MKGIVKTVRERLYLAQSEDGRFTIIDGRNKDEKSGLAPMETFLLAAAACSAVDVEVILKKKRYNIKELVIEVEGERRGEYPKIWEKVRYRYIVKGKNIREKDVKQAIELSLNKYCSASITLMRAGAKLDWEYIIEDA